jgi:hypothetical protein
MKVSISSDGKREVFLTAKEFAKLNRLAAEMYGRGEFDTWGDALDCVLHWQTRLDTSGGMWGWIDPRRPVWVGNGYFHQ